MPFELVSTLATFQRYISQILAPILEKRVLVYLNDILIANKTKEEHKRKIKEVKRLLTETRLIIKEEKCEYFKKKLKFLRFKLMKGKIGKDSQKMKVIQEWETP